VAPSTHAGGVSMPARAIAKRTTGCRHYVDGRLLAGVNFGIEAAPSAPASSNPPGGRSGGWRFSRRFSSAYEIRALAFIFVRHRPLCQTGWEFALVLCAPASIVVHSDCCHFCCHRYPAELAPWAHRAPALASASASSTCSLRPVP
jgi:hypothetical protein